MTWSCYALTVTTGSTKPTPPSSGTQAPAHGNTATPDGKNKQRNGPHPVSSRANNHPNRPNTCHLQRHGLGPSKTYKIRCGLEVGLLRPAPQRTGGSQRVQDLTAKGCEPLESS